MTSRPRVAIIGGGSAGVAQAAELLAANFHSTIFERRGCLGSGIWSLDEDPGECHILFDADGRAFPRWEENDKRKWPPSAIYPGLRTNISCDLMTYRDSPFESENIDGPFPDRGAVENYLEDWAKQRQDLARNARLNTLVTSVQRIGHPNASSRNGSGSLWRVEARNHLTGYETSEEFEYIVLASGRCSVPSIAPIPGLWNFRGTISHSAWYRTPVIYRGKKIVIVGNNSSGFDICRELQGHVVRDFQGKQEWVRDAQSGSTGVEVINSIEDVTKAPGMDYDPLDESSPEWCRRIRVVPRISRVSEDGCLVLEDGQELKDVHVLIFATGFYLQYDFLHQDREPFNSLPILEHPKRVEVSEQEAHSLQRRIDSQPASQPFALTSPATSGPSNLDDWYLFYAGDKSLAILGLPTATIPFPTAQIQARYVTAYWSGKAQELPPLDRSLPPSDCRRWTFPLNTLTGGKDQRDQINKRGHNRGPMPLLFGSPSDADYLDGLLRYIPGAGGTPPWQEDQEEEQNQPSTRNASDKRNVGLLSEVTRGEADDLQEDTASDPQSHLDLATATAAAAPSTTSSVSEMDRLISVQEARECHLPILPPALVSGEEASYDVTAWRRRRRRENKQLRRKVLGY